MVLQALHVTLEDLQVSNRAVLAASPLLGGDGCCCCGHIGMILLMHYICIKMQDTQHCTQLCISLHRLTRNNAELASNFRVQDGVCPKFCNLGQHGDGIGDQAGGQETGDIFTPELCHTCKLPNYQIMQHGQTLSNNWHVSCAIT